MRGGPGRQNIRFDRLYAEEATCRIPRNTLGPTVKIYLVNRRTWKSSAEGLRRTVCSQYMLRATWILKKYLMDSMKVSTVIYMMGTRTKLSRA